MVTASSRRAEETHGDPDSFIPGTYEKTAKRRRGTKWNGRAESRNGPKTLLRFEVDIMRCMMSIRTLARRDGDVPIRNHAQVQRASKRVHLRGSV